MSLDSFLNSDLLPEFAGEKAVLGLCNAVCTAKVRLLLSALRAPKCSIL